MPEHLKFILRTLRDPGPPVEIRCSCDDFWSVAQQHAMLQLYARIVQHQPGRIDLSRHCPRVIPPDPLPDPGWPAPRHKDPKGRWTDIEPQLRAEYHGVVVRYSSRAQRIAGAYARVFLEDFEHGKPERLGRFYWAGLAAFASKQVAFTIQNKLLLFYAPATLRALGKGNLWLYNDALPWHYAWALCPPSVRLCAQRRNAPDLHPVVLNNLSQQEWAAEVLPNLPWNFDDATATLGQPIGQLRWAPLMGEAIDVWEAYEAAIDPDRNPKPDETKKAAIAMRHLWAMARHEQGEVLQGLIYGNPRFRKEIELGRLTGMPPLSYMPFICFRMQLSFSASEYVDDPDWRSDAPPGIRIDNYHERMDWIRDTAGQYHKLMSGPCRKRLLAELRTLADHDD